MDSKNLKTFDVAPFLQQLSSNIVEGGAEQGVSLSVQAVPLDVGLDFAIPLGLLVTELVTNSMKHAFDGKAGAIEVALDEAEAGQLVLKVVDDGRGYDPNPKGGVAPSLGASIIDGLVRQMKGVLTITMDGGTHSVVRLPAQAHS